LPAALLSRFDLIFLLLDRQDVEMDVALAKHVASVHKNLAAPDVK
jgi:DNA replication licensing factor MCM7